MAVKRSLMQENEGLALGQWLERSGYYQSKPSGCEIDRPPA